MVLVSGWGYTVTVDLGPCAQLGQARAAAASRLELEHSAVPLGCSREDAALTAIHSVN